MVAAAKSQPDVRLAEIGQIATRVKNLDRAITFYRDALGLQFLFQAPPGMAFFQCGALMLMLALPENPEQDHAGSVLYFRVDDIESAHRTLMARGVRFIDAPHLIHRAPEYELWMAFFRDPDDTMLALMQRKPRLA